jgi:hypothetical protein
MIRCRRERLRICSLTERSRSSTLALTVDFTYVSGMRCGTTRISVSERYFTGRYR